MITPDTPIPYLCYGTDGIKRVYYHTLDQLKQVFSDGATFLATQLIAARMFKDNIEAASDIVTISYLKEQATQFFAV